MLPSIRKRFDTQIVSEYRALVRKHYPHHAKEWPIISGYNVYIGWAHEWSYYIFTHTGSPIWTSVRAQDPIGHTPHVDVDELRRGRLNSQRSILQKKANLGPKDGIVFVPPDQNIQTELEKLLVKHAISMGLGPMNIFLSHKSADKALVRDYKDMLSELGFKPWLDEDAMPAGTSLERGLLKGMQESCAAIFFITSNYEDSHYLATEVDYAIQQKRKKGDNFAVITLVFDELGGIRETVPELLATYVYKHPRSRLDGLREILRALPITVGPIQWRGD